MRVPAVTDLSKVLDQDSMVKQGHLVVTVQVGVGVPVWIAGGTAQGLHQQAEVEESNLVIAIYIPVDQYQEGGGLAPVLWHTEQTRAT